MVRLPWAGQIIILRDSHPNLIDMVLLEILLAGLSGYRTMGQVTKLA